MMSQGALYSLGTAREEVFRSMPRNPRFRHEIRSVLLPSRIDSLAGSTKRPKIYVSELLVSATYFG